MKRILTALVGVLLTSVSVSAQETIDPEVLASFQRSAARMTAVPPSSAKPPTIDPAVLIAFASSRALNDREPAASTGVLGAVSQAVQPQAMTKQAAVQPEAWVYNFVPATGYHVHKCQNGHYWDHADPGYSTDSVPHNCPECGQEAIKSERGGWIAVYTGYRVEKVKQSSLTNPPAATSGSKGISAETGTVYTLPSYSFPTYTRNGREICITGR
jgi:hypothetical protein